MNNNNNQLYSRIVLKGNFNRRSFLHTVSIDNAFAENEIDYQKK